MLTMNKENNNKVTMFNKKAYNTTKDTRKQANNVGKKNQK
jgi:hypothetical protein